MSKYSYEFKLKVVKEYYERGEWARYLAKKYGVTSVYQIQVWINVYEQDGEEGLNRKITKTKYSSEFKLHVILYRQINWLSYEEVANHFEINLGSAFKRWQQTNLEEGFEELNRSVGKSKKGARTTEG